MTPNVNADHSQHVNKKTKVPTQSGVGAQNDVEDALDKRRLSISASV